MTTRRLLLAGPAMILIYLACFAVAMSLAPGFSPILDIPSELGSDSIAHPWIYNGGMVATASAGWLAAIGLFSGLRRIGSGRVLAALTAGSLILASTGIAMAGLFPLPHPLHHGFGLGALGALLPLFGAIGRWRAKDVASRRDALTLLILFVMTIASAVLIELPLIVGLLIFSAVGFLCIATRSRLRA